MAPLVDDGDFVLHVGDALETLRGLSDASVDCVVTSPPYLDTRPEYDSPTELEFGAIFAQLARVVTGPMLWNVGRVWRDGEESLWWTELIRQARMTGWQHWDTEIWAKPNANPIHGRVFANSHEYTLVFGRDGVLVNEDSGRRPHAASTVSRFGRSWTNHRGVKGFPESKARKTTRAEPNPLGARPRSYIEFCVGTEKGNLHPAPMALAFAQHLVGLASWPGQTVLDPFAGSGTTAIACRNLGRLSVAIERDPDYAKMAATRLQQLSLLANA